MEGASLAEALFGRKAAEDVWQDREVRFDAPAAQLQCRRGEEVLETFVSSSTTVKLQHGGCTAMYKESHAQTAPTSAILLLEQQKV